MVAGATVAALVDAAAGVLMGEGDLEGSAEWTAEMWRMDLEGLVAKKQGWWGLSEGIKDLVGIMELLVRDIVVAVVFSNFGTQKESLFCLL